MRRNKSETTVDIASASGLTDERKGADVTVEQNAIDEQNAAFWNTLCGTGLAISLGITDRSPESLKKFDDWYFDFYPYLFRHIPFEAMRGRSVLEVGLGYGTVSQRICEVGARYNGLDIAEGPVEMVNYRLLALGLPGRAQIGNILHAPFADETFDFVVAIGCYHHTGNIRRAIAESWRILRPGGTLVVMVYNALSYRRWIAAPRTTARFLIKDLLGFGSALAGAERDRAAYDVDTVGQAAPSTAFVTRRSLRRMCSNFRSFSARLENIDQERPFAARKRTDLLRTAWPRILGLDIYARAQK
jgi:SAM-dependent methyltransferase